MNNTFMEELSRERKTIKTDSYDMSVGELINLYKEQELKLNPAYQRLYRWDDEHKTNFIESILIGIPIPPIFVAQKDDGKWDIVDGLQRISTLLQLTGDLPDYKPLVLQGTETLPSLEGMTWETMPMDAKRLLRRKRIGVNIILTKNSVSSQHELFKRFLVGRSTKFSKTAERKKKMTNREKLLDMLRQMSSEELANSIDLLCHKCPAGETCRANSNCTCQEIMMLWLELDEQVE